MKRAITLTLTALLATAGGVGCHRYEDERPDVNSLDPRDKGLQSKDLNVTTDKMAESILGDKDINARPTQMLLVVGEPINKTRGESFRQDYDIFLRRLRVALQQQGRGRIMLITNKADLQSMQSKELDTGNPDQFGQGGGGQQLPARTQPDYQLDCTITNMPNRGTDTYFFDFTIHGLKGAQAGQDVWTDGYEVKVAR